MFFATTFDLIITAITKNNDITFTFGQLQIMINDFPIDDSVKQEVINIFG